MSKEVNKVHQDSTIKGGTILETTPLHMRMKSSDQIQALADKVKERVDNFDGKAPKDVYKDSEQIGFLQLTMRYASGCDKMLFGLTVITIFLYGSM